MQKTKGELETERTRLKEAEREKECTFKNQLDEIHQLKKQVEGLKRNESEAKGRVQGLELELTKAKEGKENFKIEKT